MLEIGSLVDNKYKILNLVGQGGMSTVYLAMNEKANKQWAIKEVRKDGTVDMETVRQNLVAETDMLKKLNHPNLPSIIDVIEDDDRFLIVMDYIQGNSLNDALEEYGAQPQENVIQWAKQLCDVLGYLHSRTPAIIYRDMKPANIMLKPDGNITLIDFGTAREFKEKNLADTRCLGTIGYAAPEQFGGMGQTDARTDIYCLGATLYHLVTGMNPCKPPYEIKPIREVNPALSSGLERIILKCTKRDPNERYQSAAELQYALEHYDEIDDIYRRKQKKKLAKFVVPFVFSLVSLGVSIWSGSMATKKLSENYENVIATATSVGDYYNAILLSPERPEAYSKLVKYLISDFDLSKDEGSSITKLRTGLDSRDKKGYSTGVDVLSFLRNKDYSAYQDVCYEAGEAFLFYYFAETEKDRYNQAASWFYECTEKYPVASVYCAISDCLDAINQYNGAKIKQTEKMYEEYAALWTKLGELKTYADNSDDLDSKLQIWGEINNVIGAKVVQFLEVSDKESIVSLLSAISDEAGSVDKSVVEEDIKKLQAMISLTIDKVNSAK